nr:MAG TPA: hypothetical protein [Caudoviricetes sp.]
MKEKLIYCNHRQRGRENFEIERSGVLSPLRMTKTTTLLDLIRTYMP